MPTLLVRLGKCLSASFCTNVIPKLYKLLKCTRKTHYLILKEIFVKPILMDAKYHIQILINPNMKCITYLQRWRIDPNFQSPTSKIIFFCKYDVDNTYIHRWLILQFGLSLVGKERLLSCWLCNTCLWQHYTPQIVHIASPQLLVKQKCTILQNTRNFNDLSYHSRCNTTNCKDRLTNDC